LNHFLSKEILRRFKITNRFLQFCFDAESVKKARARQQGEAETEAELAEAEFPKGQSPVNEPEAFSSNITAESFAILLRPKV